MPPGPRWMCTAGPTPMNTSPQSSTPDATTTVVKAPPVPIWFQTHDLAEGIGRRTARGGGYTITSTAVRFVAMTVSTVLITRNLTEEDFGLFGMVAVVTGFAGMFVDLGLSRAVVQKARVTEAQVSTLFWINLAVALVLAILTAAATPLLVAAYNEPRLASINLAMASLFLVGAGGLQHRSLLERRMEFGRLNVLAVLAPVLGCSAATAAAFAGAGYWALVVLPAATQCATVLGLWLACPWVPSRPRRGTGVGEMLRFGGNVTGFQFVNYFARSADNAMLGFAWGASPLGLYTRAYSLMMLPASQLNAPLTAVAVPALSRLVEQPERFRRFYRESIAAVALVTLPAVMLLSVLSPELIPVLLGPQWSPAVPLLLLLTPAALVACTNVASGWLYLSFGHVDRMFRWSMWMTPCLLLGMAIGLQYGPRGMAATVGMIYALQWLPSIQYATRGTPVTLRDYCEPVFPLLGAILFAGVIAMLGSFLLRKAPEETCNIFEATSLTPIGALKIILLKIILYGGVLIAAGLFVRPVRTRIRSTVNLVGSRLRSTSLPDPANENHYAEHK